MTMEAQRMREATDVQLEYLEKLGEELARRGMQVRMVLPAGRVPSLYVVNPTARALEEHIYAGCGSDGAWCTGGRGRSEFPPPRTWPRRPPRSSVSWPAPV